MDDKIAWGNFFDPGDILFWIALPLFWWIQLPWLVIEWIL